MKSRVFEITEEGDLRGLYTDDIDLFAVGLVTNVRKASNVEFNESTQMWDVMTLQGEVLHSCKNREEAIEWEIQAFSPNGLYYEQISF